MCILNWFKINEFQYKKAKKKNRKQFANKTKTGFFESDLAPFG